MLNKECSTWRKESASFIKLCAFLERVSYSVCGGCLEHGLLCDNRMNVHPLRKVLFSCGREKEGASSVCFLRVFYLTCSERGKR